MLFPFSSEVKSVFTFQIKEEQQKSSALMYTQTLTQYQQTGKNTCTLYILQLRIKIGRFGFETHHKCEMVV